MSGNGNRRRHVWKVPIANVWKVPISCAPSTYYAGPQEGVTCPSECPAGQVS